MIVAVRLATLLYTLLVRLYPQTFRATFEEEMRTVFKQALVEAAGQGWTTLVTVCLRELGGLPTTLLREYRGDLRNKKGKEKRMKVFYLFGLIVLTIACWLVAGMLWGSSIISFLIVLPIVVSVDPNFRMIVAKIASWCKLKSPIKPISGDVDDFINNAHIDR